MLFLLALSLIAAAGLLRKKHRFWAMSLQFLAAVFVGLDFIERGDKSFAIAAFGIGLLYLGIDVFLYRRGKTSFSHHN